MQRRWGLSLQKSGRDVAARLARESTMRLINAKFTNFRILRDLELDFGTREQKLFVIRAENESGKTTMLNALQWALYGDEALPAERREYRLHPIDWDISRGARVPISVEVVFQAKTARRSRTHGFTETVRTYRIIRSTYDLALESGWDPGPARARLFEVTPNGTKPIEPPEAMIRESLPTELREIFFTDGDRALSFIEANVSASTKQARVKNAIESLLNLDIIKSAEGHVKKTLSEANKKLGNTVSDKPLSEIAWQVSELAESEVDLESKIREAAQQFAAFDERYLEVDKKIEVVLSKGDRDDLNDQISQTRDDIKIVETEQTAALAEHASLIFGMAASCGLMASSIESSLKRLGVLRDQGKIPNSAIPVLEERLRSDECICGESLLIHDAGAHFRRERIEQLIAESEKSDGLNSVITDLYYASRDFGINTQSPSETWRSRYEVISKRRDDLEHRRDNLGRREKSLEAVLEGIPNADLQGLRENRNWVRDQRDRFNRERERHENDLRNVRHRKAELEKERDRLLRNQSRGRRIMADFTVAEDIQAVLSGAYRRLATDELAKVGDRMNDIFLEMVVSDPSQGAIIQSAEITEDFEIVVYGSGRRLLNPDRDLNGASRRALTLAFVLALAKVSEVEAPNVIDTPLGMMSGLVKTSSLTAAMRESSQLILFLTRSEIAGCEEILDSENVKVVTLTNSAHYPTMLTHDPGVDFPAVLKCDCGHRGECITCERRERALAGSRLSAQE